MPPLSNESEIPLPVPGDNIMETSEPTPLPILYIISWGHRYGPLLPAPLVSIDIRNLPNPPKQMRKHNGTSKALREWLFSNEAVRGRFEDACMEIRMRLSEAAANGNPTVTVGVNCEMGRHRSVAFVEEMGHMKWDGWGVAIEHRDVNARRRSPKFKRKGALGRMSNFDE